MNPEEWILRVLEDNDAFAKSKGHSFFSSFAQKQNPGITMLTCSDSRVCTNAISKDPVNRIFAIENIGNQISTAEGSVDYGIRHLKTPLLLIVGHSDCGAIKACMSGFENEPLSIQKELISLPAHLVRNSQQSSGFNPKQLIDNILKNIHYQVDVAMNKYEQLVRSRELAIAGTYYDFRNDLEHGSGRLLIVNINGIRTLIAYEDILTGKKKLDL